MEIRPTTGGAAAPTLTSSGGLEPVWRRESDAPFYRANGRLMVVTIKGGVSTGPPRAAFDGMAEAGTFDAAGYDVMPGANRFLMITAAAPASTASQLRVILNWAPGAASR